MVAFDDGCIAPIPAGKPNMATASWLNERRRDREAFIRGRAETGSRVRRRDRKLLQHQVYSGRMAVDAARQVDYCLDSVAVRATVRHLPLVLINDTGHYGMIPEGSGRRPANWRPA